MEKNEWKERGNRRQREGGMITCTLHQLETDPAEVQSLSRMQHVDCSVHFFVFLESGSCGVASYAKPSYIYFMLVM